MKPKDSRICIIGAGAAGLSAAHFLKERGYESVTVLERSGRIGGKCRSIDYRGHSFDLGANYVTAAYSEVRRLARQHGCTLYTESPAAIAHALPCGKIVFSTPLSGILRNQSLVSVATAMLRYGWARFRLQSAIDQPGFAAVSRYPDLCTSFRVWLQANGLTALAPMFEVPVTVMGYGHLDEIPAPYALKYLGLPTYFNLVALALGLPRRWPKRFTKGFERLWDKVAAQLDVRLKAGVAAVDRGDSIRVRLHGGGTLEFDYLVLACPLEIPCLAEFLTLSNEEHDLFRRINSNRYAVITYAIPNLRLPKRIVGMSPIPEPGRPWAITQQFQDSEFVQFYTRLDGARTVSEAEVIDGVRRFVTSLGATLPQNYLTYDAWSYFPHVAAEDFRDGFYDRFEALQGRSKTFYCGGIAAFELVETVVQYSRQLVESYF